MENKKSIIFGFVLLAGFIFSGALLIKLIQAVMEIPIKLGTWFLSFVNISVTILGIGIGIVSFLLIIRIFLWSIVGLYKRISGYFNQLNSKFSELLENKAEKIWPILIAGFSEAFIMLLSDDFTPGSTKSFLSIILIFILTAALISTSRMKKKYIGGLAIILLVILTTWLILAKYEVSNIETFQNFIKTQWSELVILPLIDLLSIGLIILGFALLTILSVYYSLKKIS